MPVSSLDALLPALAVEQGRAQRSASLRHRHLSDDAVVVLPFQIGGESFAVGAVMWGTSRDAPNLVVVRDPRNRQEFYDAIVPFTDWVDQYFHSLSSARDYRTSRTGREYSIARRAPQVIVPNSASAQLLGRMGRRLAHLGASPHAISPSLVPAGRHLLFLRDQLRVPGQQIVLPLTDLLASHWSTPQTTTERLSLPALFAWVDPPSRCNGFDAAEEAENAISVGPIPPGAHDERLFDLVSKRRARSMENKPTARIGRLIDQAWQHLLEPAWKLCWDVIEEEEQWDEAPSVARRWEEDRGAYTRHIDWQKMAGHRRLREKPLQAARRLTDLEQALARLETEEATDDPVRMIPHVLRGSALMGSVVRVDRSHRERSASGQLRSYPVVTLSCSHECVMPLGKKLFWSADPGGSGWHVVEIAPAADGVTSIRLRREKSPRSGTALPTSGEVTSFSDLSINTFRPLFPKEQNVPWTHRVHSDSSLAGLDNDPPPEDQAAVVAGDPRDRERDD